MDQESIAIGIAIGMSIGIALSVATGNYGFIATEVG